MATVLITGGTGYIGRPLIRELLQAGYSVRAVVRKGSEQKLPNGCAVIVADALDPKTYMHDAIGCDAFVHLVGVAHPSPSKGAEFRRVDLASVRAAVDVTKNAAIPHFIYLSVAHPAPVMKAYTAVRAEGEEMIRLAGLRATILRPWYVLGPGHRWPLALMPAYWILERLPQTRPSAERLGLVALAEMVAALVTAVGNPADNLRVIDVPAIRAAKRNQCLGSSAALSWR